MTNAWPTKPLRDLGTWYGGGTPSKSRPEFWEGGHVPWLSPKDMGADVIGGTRDHITPTAIEHSAVRLVPENSVAIVVRSGILERTLPVARVPFGTTLNQDMKALSPSKGVDPRWVAFGLRAHEQELLATTRKAGTTVASIETRKLKAFALPVPPLSEQHRIIEILEGHLSRLEAADTLLQKTQTQLNSFAASILSDLILPGAGRSLFSKDPACLGGDVRPDVSLPDGWRWSRWRDLGNCQNGKPFPSREYTDEGVPLLRPGNLGPQGSLHWGPAATRHLPERYRATHSALLIQPGDIVMNLTAQSLRDDFLGRVCLVSQNDEALLNQRLARLVATEVEPEFALAVFRSRLFRHYVKSLSTGSLIQHMFTKQVDRFWMPVPPRHARGTIVAEVQNASALVLRQESVIAAARQRAVALRRALLAAAFSGTLTGAPTDIERVEEMADA